MVVQGGIIGLALDQNAKVALLDDGKVPEAVWPGFRPLGPAEAVAAVDAYTVTYSDIAVVVVGVRNLDGGGAVPVAIFPGKVVLQVVLI